MYALAVVLTLFVLSIAFLAASLRRIGSWRAAHRLRLSRCVLAVLTCHLVAIPCWVAIGPILPAEDDDIGGPTIIYTAVWLFTSPWLYLLGDRALWSATKRWVAFGVPVALVGFGFVHFIEEFVIQTERPLMLGAPPSIRGRHTVEPCPKCGGEFVSELLSFPVRAGDERRWVRGSGVCRDCFHTEFRPGATGAHREPDHYVINHLRAPERWRLVAFANTSSSSSFPKLGRLVGLPGETIVIRDGAVWVNNERQTPPAAVGSLRYTEVVPERVLQLANKKRERGFGHPNEPLTLAADEYFILNDDPNSTLDSRAYGPFKWQFYLGAVEFVFWPPARWGLVR